MVNHLSKLALALLWLLFASALCNTSAVATDAASFFSDDADNNKDPYITWLSDNASKYDHHTFLSTKAPDNTNHGMAVFWRVVDGDDIQFAFATMATGWVALGIAEAGGMLGADIVTLTADKSDEIIDGYILDERKVYTDDNSQDWTLISSTVDNGWIIVEVRRKLDTGDTQDHAIKNDIDFWVPPTRLIAAWGDSESVSYHGENRASTSVRIFADPTVASSGSMTESEALTKEIEKSADGFFDVTEDSYEIPSEETKYKYVCKTYDELKEQFGNETDVTMVGATPIITEETREFVHHFVVMTTVSCDRGEIFANFLQREQIFLWAPGYHGMALPEDVGFPLFDSESNQAILIEIHYNNPKLISGKVDSSGVRFHYTKTPRKHKAGILQLGDPLLGLMGEEINDGLTKHEFTCGGTCSSLFLDEPVTVLAESLHMHRTGVRMTNEVIRDGEVYHYASVEVYDFEQQGSFNAQQQPYQLEAGDSFRTTCYYKDGKRFAEGSEEEMCIAFLFYYPIKKFAGYPFVCPYPGQFPCTEEYVSTDLSGYDGLERTFGTPRVIASNETLSPTPFVNEKMDTAAPIAAPTAVPSALNGGGGSGSGVSSAKPQSIEPVTTAPTSSSHASLTNWLFVLVFPSMAMLASKYV
jgi:hypothetical protein